MNILTFDIEEWYLEKVNHGGRENLYNLYDETFCVLLDELDKQNIKATFFCVGKLAKDFPNVVQEISNRGHEVGCHSNIHTWVNKMTEDELRQDTIEAIKALEDVSGQKVTAYRAPAFSITTENKWAVNVLADCGIESDASIFPTNRDYGGYKDFPQDTPCVISNEGARLKEYPISLTRIMGKHTAFSGGGYFRVLPLWLVSKAMANRNYNIFYFHLNDLTHQRLALKSRVEYEEYFKEPGTLKNRMVRYFKSNISIGDTFRKLRQLMRTSQFCCVAEANNTINWNNVSNIKLDKMKTSTIVQLGGGNFVSIIEFGTTKALAA